MARDADRRDDNRPSWTVPRRDEGPTGLIYAPHLAEWTLIGASVGGVLLALLGWAITSGPLPIAGLGQFSAAGDGAAVFMASGVGVALGGAVGALAALKHLGR